MKKMVLAVFSLLLVAGCDAFPGGASVPSPQPGLKKALPIIAVRASEITVNGQPVWLGDTLDAWKRSIGGKPDCYDAGMIITCVWHSNGLSIGTDHLDKTKVKFISIDLTIEPPDGERAPSFPQSPFRGTLEVDGFPIRHDTPFREVRRQTPPAREMRCGDRACGNPSAAFSDGANIYMNLARRSENAPILNFSISCSSTELCTSLIPGRTKK